jgi:hypothetical protein
MTALPPLTIDTVLRDVQVEDHRLILWETGRRDSMGRTYLAYRLLDATGRTIFEGQDFSPGMATCIDSDDAVRGILGFLTLKDGDTDSEYFDSYTPEQLAWRDEHAERLYLYGLDPDDSEEPIEDGEAFTDHPDAFEFGTYEAMEVRP